jgi:hypothetical protein
MRIRVLLAVAGATLAIAACGESATGPKLQPSARTNDDITCRSGYHVATRADGTQYCEPDGGDSVANGGGSGGGDP